MGQETLNAFFIKMLYDRKLIHTEWICLEVIRFTFMFYYQAKCVKSFAVERSSSTNNSQVELPYFLK